MDDIERPQPDESADRRPESNLAPEPPRLPALPAIADGVERAVDPGWVTATRITSSIGALVTAVPLLGGAIAFGVLSDGLPGVVSGALICCALGIVGLLAWGAVGLPALRYRHLRYRVDEAGIAIRRGIWWREEIRVPRSRVQHTDVTQGPIERSFGLASLIVFTAGTQHARVALEGLRVETSREIRDFLVEGGGADGV